MLEGRELIGRKVGWEAFKVAKMGDLGAELEGVRGKEETLPGAPDRHDGQLAQGCVEESGHGGDGLENPTLACKRDETSTGPCNGDVCLVG